MKLSNEVYDTIKKWVLPLLTGGATFYLTLGDLWHLPYTKEVTALTNWSRMLRRIRPTPI